MMIGWYRNGDSSFVISKTTTIGKAFMGVHPFSTIINAEKIGDNFNCKNCTTIASKHTMDDRPIIGDNVELGANVVIIGPVVIGNNVVRGAGSVVVKDIPDNVIVAGNPAKYVCTVEEYIEKNKKYNTDSKGLSKEKKKRLLLSLDENKFVHKSLLKTE